MKNKYLYLIFLPTLILGGCEKSKYMFFNDIARIQMDEEKEIRTDFLYKDKSITRDTVFLTVNTSGYPSDRPRRIALEQISEYDVKYLYDNKGNLTDSIVTEKPHKAAPGIHYVAMDDAEMEPLLVIPPHAVTLEVPVILLRDTSLTTEEYRLCLKLKATEDFTLGEKAHLSGTIIFSDKLSQPAFWTTHVETYYFGKYSTRKHEFMFEVIQEKLTDQWYKRIITDYAELLYIQDKLKKALDAYNSDPANLATGKAPMRENQDDPNSELITFPIY